VDDILQPGAVLRRPGRASAGRARAAAPRGSLALGARFGEFDVLGAVAGFSNNNFTDGRGTTIPYTGDNATTLLGKFGWNPGNHRFQVSALRFRDDHQLPISANTAARPGISDRDTVQESLSFRWSYANPDMPLLEPSVVLYRNRVEIEEQRLTGTRARDRTELTTHGVDAQNTARFDLGAFGRHALTFGAEYYRDEQEGSSNGLARAQFPTRSRACSASSCRTRSPSVPSPSLLASASTRFDQESPDGRNDRRWTGLSPRISLAWQATPWLQPYVSYAEGFRSPSLTELYVGGQHFPGNRFVPNPGPAAGDQPQQGDRRQPALRRRAAGGRPAANANQRLPQRP
jgi:hemoglobin/transferrin/lactoferrin receptor protein